MSRSFSKPMNQHLGQQPRLPACARDLAGTIVTSTYPPSLVTEEKRGWPVG